ncbi:MAG TPA: tRNA epoxyqueuosine(34) reductase QueG [Bacteroidales bacterium]|nr:tRNA epoxyqueuosine(34) reductase QueG [Bacteroidales bacterium]
MNLQNKHELTTLIKNKAKEAGFDLCGIAPAGILEENASILNEWCASGMNAGMDYMSRNIDKRADPSSLLPGVRSVIVTGLNYYTERKQGGGEVPVMSVYAYGRDYHEVVMKKLQKVIKCISEIDDSTTSRAFVDSVPFFEKPWAVKAGIGWQGKHSIVINEKTGSFFFIGVILTTLALEYDSPAADRCGSCNLCMEACPTNAINKNRTIDAGKCIAYLTIDNRNPVSDEDIEKLGGRIIGCDRCQEVCPWNRHAIHHKVPDFEISEELRKMTSEQWLNLSKEDYDRLFSHSAVRRRKFEVFIQNVTNVTKFLRDGNGKADA